MGRTSDLLERAGASRVSQAVVDFFAMIMGFMNMIFRPVEMLVKTIADGSAGVSRMTWVIDLAISVSAIVYIFMTEVTDIPRGAFAVTEVMARGVIFLSALALTLLSLSSVLSYMFTIDGLIGPVAGIVGAGFSEKYDAYLATFRHGVHSMLTVAITMLWGLNDDRTIRWTGSDGGDDDSTLTFLIGLFIALVVSKFLSEVRHGQDARVLVAGKEMIGTSVPIISDYRFKHARGAALTVSTGLLAYMLANADLTGGVLSFIGSKMVALSLSTYILVVSLERIAGQREWVVGGAGGLVITGAVSFWNLIAAGLALAEDKSQAGGRCGSWVHLPRCHACRIRASRFPRIAVVSDVRKGFPPPSSGCLQALLSHL
jgi:hypothetical protein